MARWCCAVFVVAMIKILSVFKKRPDPEPPAAAASEQAPQAQSPLTETDWSRLRAPQFGHEKALSGWTRSWLEALPASLRPVGLSAQYPHVANCLALAWRDPSLTNDLLRELLIGRREARKGFPAEVVAELRCLRDFHDRGRAVPAPPESSDTLPLELSDR